MERFIDSSTSQHLRRHRSGQTTDGRLRVKTNSRRYPGESPPIFEHFQKTDE
jgi:hypothetical protein